MATRSLPLPNLIGEDTAELETELLSNFWGRGPRDRPTELDNRAPVLLAAAQCRNPIENDGVDSEADSLSEPLAEWRG